MDALSDFCPTLPDMVTSSLFERFVMQSLPRRLRLVHALPLREVGVGRNEHKNQDGN
jgi:hypothetical protein